jgi:hypothetical protein
VRDVVGSEDVCVFCGVSAVPTDELGLAGPVAFVDMAAAGAALACVGRVHLDDRHTRAGCFVGEEHPELGEGPAVCVARWGLRSRTRSRIPVNSSTAIPRPVRSASATILLEIW